MTSNKNKINIFIVFLGNTEKARNLGNITIECKNIHKNLLPSNIEKDSLVELTYSDKSIKKPEDKEGIKKNSILITSPLKIKSH